MSQQSDHSHEPRLVAVSRRAFLRRSAVAGAVVVAIPGLASCGDNDAAVFADAETSTTTSTSGSPETTEPSESTIGPAATEESTPPTTSDVSGAAFPAGAELAVAFTYDAGSSRGPVRNPYVAVWIEDSDGNLVDTISLWYLQSQKGVRWLNELRRWYAASDGAAETSMSGATRVAGAYTVAWDGTDLDGIPIAPGDYVLYIEGAREHGPYSLTSTTLTIGADAFTVDLPDDGEIVAASAELIV